MTILNYFFNLFRKAKGTGANLDLRTESEKLKDYLFKEIVASAAPVTWVEKNQDQWRHFPIFNQNGSGSCVAQTGAKLLGVMYWLKNQVYVHFSAVSIYQRRSNKPNTGMGGTDAFDLMRQGVTLEELVPSQKMTDAQMDVVVIPDYKQKVGEIFKISNYIILPVKDITTVASVIQTTGKAVMVWFSFKIDEWTSHPVIKYPDLTENSIDASRHSLAAVDFCLVNGKKSLIIDDSWGTSYGAAGQRVIDEDFFKVRNFFAAYPMNFAFDDILKPKYHFTKVLAFGITDPDVMQLQKVLQYEGFFPTNVIPTNYFGSITAQAVLKFQLKYFIDSVATLQALQGRSVGSKTLLKLNELYNS